MEIDPDAPVAARDLRAWLIRVVRFLVGQAGIDQFLDCGSGLPTAENVHQAAQRVSPDVKVVYVDNDPIVAAHARALLEEAIRPTSCSRTCAGRRICWPIHWCASTSTSPGRWP